MTVPKVSIGLPTYNRAKFIGKAIESVVMQSFRDWELIISDDASIDETPVIVRAWQEKDSRIHYRKNESNVGIARNINQGIRGAQGELIALIDDDDSWIPKDKLEKQIAFLDSHPDYVGVGGGMVVVDREGKEL
ncbi:MAG: glycosyltransferase family 2 protein, partial [Parcubacteria group bacterium]|nr:glycosyltransferase family 2 protein [Parcubacteria group bacterium]